MKNQKESQNEEEKLLNLIVKNELYKKIIELQEQIIKLKEELELAKNPFGKFPPLDPIPKIGDEDNKWWQHDSDPIPKIGDEDNKWWKYDSDLGDITFQSKLSDCFKIKLLNGDISLDEANWNNIEFDISFSE